MTFFSRCLIAGVSLLDRALPLLALALIGVGAGLMYLPAAPLIVGLLLWIDLHRKETPP